MSNIDEIVKEALEVVRSGGLILYPTDTVWGIGCDACNEAAVQKVFALKRRSGAKSLVLLASDLDMVARYVRKVPPMAADLVEVNDAPMTIVYPGAVVADFGLAPSVVAEDGSVGIRIPRVEASGRDSKGGSWDERPVSAGAVFCNRLIYRLRRPLVSTSANISGEETPSCFAEISEEIRSGVDYVVPASVTLEAAGKPTAAGKGEAAGAGKPTAVGKGSVRFDDSATGQSSQIIKLGLDGEVEIIRP